MSAPFWARAVAVEQSRGEALRLLPNRYEETTGFSLHHRGEPVVSSHQARTTEQGAGTMATKSYTNLKPGDVLVRTGLTDFQVAIVIANVIYMHLPIVTDPDILCDVELMNIDGERYTLNGIPANWTTPTADAKTKRQFLALLAN